MFWNHCLLAAQKLLRCRTCWTSSVLASHLLGATGGDRRTKPSCFGRIGWLKWMFFFVCFFHTYIHTKWVSFLVNVPCLAIKIVCLDLWCWELNAHYWCKYCFCFPFRLEGTRPVTLEQMLFFASGIDCIPPLGFPNHPTIQFLHDSNGYRRIFPEANTCEVILRLPLHPSYSIFTEYMESGILQSPTFGLIWVHVKVKSSLAFFTISLTILKCATTRCIFFLVGPES